MSFPLIIRDKNDKPVRRFRYVESASGFMLREVFFNPTGVLTLTHQIGVSIATVKASTSGIVFDIHDHKLFQYFKSRPVLPVETDDVVGLQTEGTREWSSTST